jgi:hypothetical protein
MKISAKHKQSGAYLSNRIESGLASPFLALVWVGRMKWASHSLEMAY